MRNVFKQCVVLTIVWGISLGLAGCNGPDGDESSSTIPLIGTSWTLVSLGERGGSDGPAVTLRFETKVKLGGFDGCNAYTGAFSVDGSTLHIPGEMAATRAACPEPIAGLARAYVEALARAASFAIEGDRLQLQDDSGQMIAAFKAASLTLAETAWEVVGYNNGKQAVISVLRGTHITARFAEDGRVTGSAGCNQYFASWETAAESITVGMPATTRMACAEPDGIMEQEARYLEALHTAASFRFDGDRLVLRTAEGVIAVTLARDAGVPPVPGSSPAARLRFDLNK